MRVLSKKGFGLVEVIIAVGITTVLGLGLSQIMRFQVQGQNAVSANEAIANVQRVVSAAMNEYPTCHVQPFVAGLVFSTALPAALQPPTPVAGGKITYKSPPAPPGSVIFSTTAPHDNLGDGLTIKNIQIQPYSQIDATTYIVMLQVVATKNVGSVSGSNIFTANIPISVQATAISPTKAQITDCTNTALCQPPNWSQVIPGPVGESFCINTTATFQPASGLFAAAATCAKQNAHLCTSEEWMEACKYAGGGFDSFTLQWVAAIYGRGCGTPGCWVRLGGGAGCAISGAGGTGWGSAVNYRCCHR